MSEYKINEIKGALSNTIGQCRILNTTVTTEKIKTHLLIKKVTDLEGTITKLNKRIDSLELLLKAKIKQDRRTVKKATKQETPTETNTPKEITIYN